MSDLLDKLEEHEFPTEDVRICLKPKLLTEREAAMARVSRAQQKRTKSSVEDDRLGAPAAPAVNPAVAEAIAAVTKLNEQIQAASITIRIVGVDRLKYNRYVLANPPRRGKNEPYDSSKFYMYVAKETGVYVDAAGDTHPITADEWSSIDTKLSDGEHDRVAQAVLNVNRTVGAQDVSFFVNGSETTPDSSETSD